MMYLPDVLSGKSLVLTWLSCVLLPRGLMAPGIAGTIWSLSPGRSLVCIHNKLKSAKSSTSLFMFPVHISLREDRRSYLQYAKKCLITLQSCMTFMALVVQLKLTQAMKPINTGTNWNSCEQFQHLSFYLPLQSGLLFCQKYTSSQVTMMQNTSTPWRNSC